VAGLDARDDHLRLKLQAYSGRRRRDLDRSATVSVEDAEQSCVAGEAGGGGGEDRRPDGAGGAGVAGGSRGVKARSGAPKPAAADTSASSSANSLLNACVGWRRGTAYVARRRTSVRVPA
jgi:hypothetical protein